MSIPTIIFPKGGGFGKNENSRLGCLLLPLYSFTSVFIPRVLPLMFISGYIFIIRIVCL